MNADTLREMLDKLIKRLGDQPKIPDVCMMNWSTWCKFRRDLKAAGIPIEYRRVARHRWTRYVNGCFFHIYDSLEGDKVYTYYKPKPEFAAMLGKNRAPFTEDDLRIQYRLRIGIHEMRYPPFPPTIT